MRCQCFDRSDECKAQSSCAFKRELLIWPIKPERFRLEKDFYVIVNIRIIFLILSAGFFFFFFGSLFSFSFYQIKKVNVGLKFKVKL